MHTHLRTDTAQQRNHAPFEVFFWDGCVDLTLSNGRPMSSRLDRVGWLPLSYTLL
jgi:hypothetical protein